MEKGIICFETGEFAKYSTENQFTALPLLEFMKQAMGIDYIYRQIATHQELEYYLKKIGDKRFQHKFDVVFSKSKTLIFSSIRSLCVDLGITTTSLWSKKRRATCATDL